MSSLEVTDAEAAAVAIAPRVTLADLEANIVGRHFCSGADITLNGTCGTLTICLLVLRNGFCVIGKSAPAEEANFNRDLGRKFAYEDAVRQVWPLMGYALRQRRMDLRSAQELPKETT